MSYKIVFVVGESIDITTKASAGRLSLEGGRLSISGPEEISIPFESLRSAEKIRMHAFRMLKIQHTAGTLFVVVVWLNLFGLFVLVNSFATDRLLRELDAALPFVKPPAPTPDAASESN